MHTEEEPQQRPITLLRSQQCEIEHVIISSPNPLFKHINSICGSPFDSLFGADGRGGGSGFQNWKLISLTLIGASQPVRCLEKHQPALTFLEVGKLSMEMR